ncbi:uncharacterized protein [Venturia canescens]|uniref:uncharacterized protein n=1 Tax=Venturia canescens TaxID=32260 RepID=UPI001C9BCACE|nr:uncharacterized protein LOC122413825 [Venturia canescens]
MLASFIPPTCVALYPHAQQPIVALYSPTSLLSWNFLEAKINNVLQSKGSNAVKVYAVLAAKFTVMKNDEEVFDTKFFNTKAAPIFGTTDIRRWFAENIQEPIQTDLEEFEEQGSGWSLHSIINMTLHINKFNPMRGSSYVDLPAKIRNKNACINVQNNDEQCFKWAILSALHPTNYSNRVSEYRRYEQELNFDGIEFPVEPRKISKFEKQNEVSVNVYILKKKKHDFDVLPLHVTDAKKQRHVNLLLVQDHYVEEEGEEEDEECYAIPRLHYVWIKDLSRLVSTQLSNGKRKLHICDRCLHFYHTEDKLAAHEVDCKKVNKCKVTMPKWANRMLRFKNHGHKERVPFIMYADFECLLKPTRDENAYQSHEAFSVGYYVKCSYDDSLSRYRSHRGPKPAEWFVRELQNFAQELDNVHANPRPMEALTRQQVREFHNAIECHICQKPLLGGDRVRDHCHLTGKYRGAAHNECNLNYQDSRTVPIVFHNLTGYDSHFIIREIATCFPGPVEVLPETKERYISFTKHVAGSDVKFRFIDSFRFMASSLEKLASDLSELRIVRGEFPHLSDEKFELLTRKGVFPYEYADSVDKLQDIELPPKASFHSSLTGSDISDADYEHAKRVWDEFEIRSLGEYSDLYLKTDVLLLADVFENFRNNSVAAYGLDPAHYYTLPGYSWDAMFRYTQVQLELLTDPDMHLFVEQGIRGGISQCSNRYARANNKYMSDYDANEEAKYLMYFDVNNLYGRAMMEYLPQGGFEWFTGHNVDFLNVPDDSPVGYILEVDLDYPENCHDSHKDLPLCPEHKSAPGSKQNKLMTTLEPKKRYILHYRNLKQAVQQGMKLVRVHRVLKFRQSAWLRPYIELNSELRKRARNEFEKNLYKLMNNAVFGKTMENVRKHVTVKLVRKWGGRYGAEALIAKPNFHSCSIFGENLVAIQLTKTEVYLNKPIYVGLSVLDLSKIHVYDFHYEYMKREFDDRCKLLYTDTDSLLYEIRCNDIYAIMKRDIKRFDTSDYPPNNRFGMPQANKKVIGLMKDECNGRIMTEFVGLRSKMYCVRVEGRDRIKRVKGVKRSVVEASITFDDFLRCLRDKKAQRRVQCVIRSRLHNVFTERQSKVALSAHDDKRILLPGSTDTLPWGHFRAPPPPPPLPPPPPPPPPQLPPPLLPPPPPQLPPPPAP